MDDADDRAYARAPQFEDVIQLCRRLNAARARYVLIGGFAVGIHGFTRALARPVHEPGACVIETVVGR